MTALRIQPPRLDIGFWQIQNELGLTFSLVPLGARVSLYTFALRRLATLPTDKEQNRTP